jgi:hypothetical protein
VAQNYILPPAIGVENDLYEAYPQGPGTPNYSFNSPNIAPISTSANSGSLFSQNYWDSSTYAPSQSPYSFDNSQYLAGFQSTSSTSTAGASSTQSSQPSPWNPSTWQLPSLGNVITGMMNGPGGASQPNTIFGVNVMPYIDMILIFFLGLVLIGGGLFLFAHEQGLAPAKVFAKK